MAINGGGVSRADAAAALLSATQGLSGTVARGLESYATQELSGNGGSSSYSGGGFSVYSAGEQNNSNRYSNVNAGREQRKLDAVSSVGLLLGDKGRRGDSGATQVKEGERWNDETQGKRWWRNADGTDYYYSSHGWVKQEKEPDLKAGDVALGYDARAKIGDFHTNSNGETFIYTEGGWETFKSPKKAKADGETKSWLDKMLDRGRVTNVELPAEPEDVTQRPDFAEKATEGQQMEGYDKGGYVVRGNKINYAEKNRDWLEKQTALDHRDLGVKNLWFATEKEKQVYGYYLASEGEKRADKYLASIQESLNQRAARITAESIESDQGTSRVVREVLAGLQGGNTSGLEGTRQNLKGEARATSEDEYIAQYIQDNIAKRKGEGFNAESLAVGAASTIGNMLPSLAVGMLNPVAGAVTMGLGVKGNEFKNALDDGRSRADAEVVSTAKGITAGALQYALGGIEALGGKVTGNVTAKLVNSIENSVAKGLVKFGGSILSENFEEILENKLGTIVENVVYGENTSLAWNQEDWDTVVMTTITTALLQAPVSFNQNTDAKTETAPNKKEAELEQYDSAVSDAYLKQQQNAAARRAAWDYEQNQAAESEATGSVQSVNAEATHVTSETKAATLPVSNTTITDNNTPVNTEQESGKADVKTDAGQASVEYTLIDDADAQQEAINSAYDKAVGSDKTVEIPDTIISKYADESGNPIQNLIKAVKDYYDTALKGTSVEVSLNGGIIEVKFENDGKKKSVGWRMNANKAASFEKLHQLFETAEYAYSEANRNEAERSNVPYFHYYVANARINGRDIPVKLQVREISQTNGYERRYYTHNLVNEKGSHSPGTDSNAVSSHGNAYASSETNIPDNAEPVKTTPQTESNEKSNNQPANDTHIDRRDFASVADRKVKSFQFEHPELHEYYVQTAKQLMDEVEAAYDESNYKKGINYHRTKNKRQETNYRGPIRVLLNYGMTKPRIMKCLEDIINDKGAENYADAKRVEIVLNDMLTDGYERMSNTVNDSEYSNEYNEDEEYDEFDPYNHFFDRDSQMYDEGDAYNDYGSKYVQPNEAYIAVKDKINGGKRKNSWENYFDENSLSVYDGLISEEKLREEWERLYPEELAREKEEQAIDALLSQGENGQQNIDNAVEKRSEAHIRNEGQGGINTLPKGEDSVQGQEKGVVRDSESGTSESTNKAVEDLANYGQDKAERDTPVAEEAESEQTAEASEPVKDEKLPYEPNASNAKGNNSKDSRFATNTAKKTEKGTDVPEEAKLDPKYRTTHESESLKEARARLKADRAGEIEKLKASEAWSGIQTDMGAIVAQDIYKECKQSGDFKPYLEWKKVQMAHAIETGRGVQANAKYSRGTGESIMSKVASRLDELGLDEATANEVLARCSEVVDKLDEIMRKSESYEAEADERAEMQNADGEIVTNGREITNADLVSLILKTADTRKTSTIFKGTLAKLLYKYSDNTDYLRSIVEHQAYGIAEDMIAKVAPDIGARVKAFQAWAQLFSLGSTGRNIGGNTVHGTMDTFAVGATGRMADAFLSLFTGKRTIYKDKGIFAESFGRAVTGTGAMGLIADYDDDALEQAI